MANDLVTLRVEGMSCMHCAGSIKKAVGALHGVSSVEVDLEAKKVRVEHDPELVSTETIRNVIEDQGYDVK